jgi:DNA-binding NarL/FixJ family response regulator
MKEKYLIRILIADDHAVIRAGVRTILTSRADIEVDEAVDGAEAVGKALRFKPDLVILDLTMPVMGGYAAAVELRRLAPEIPVLFFSIHEGPQLIRDAKEVGARGFLKKSDAACALLDAVDELVTYKGTFFPESAETQVFTC